MIVTFTFISVLSAFGMAIALVEKRFDWPIRPISIKIRRFLQKFIHRKMHRLLKCSVCTSFWTPIFTDCILGIYTYIHFGRFYFLWPITGFITLGLTWVVMNIFSFLERLIEVKSETGI